MDAQKQSRFNRPTQTSQELQLQYKHRTFMCAQKSALQQAAQSGFERGYALGMRQAKMALVQSMLHAHIEHAQIQRLTNLSDEELQMLLQACDSADESASVPIFAFPVDV